MTTADSGKTSPTPTVRRPDASVCSATHQLVIDFHAARAAGEAAGQRCLAKAADVSPGFAQAAESAILRHLKVVRRASGEDLTSIAKASGAVPHDDRAFGPVFGSLSRRNLIRTAGFCMRSKGHGTAGGRIWELVGDGS